MSNGPIMSSRYWPVDQMSDHQIRIVANDFAAGAACSCMWRGTLHDNQVDAQREHASHVARATRPAEPLSDVLATPDPDSATQTTPITEESA